MAKKGSAKNGAAADGKTRKQGQQNGASVASYFRAVFTEKPEWLQTRSNEELLKRWLSDHPGEPEVPERIRNILANTKSVMRKEVREAGETVARKPKKAAAVKQKAVRQAKAAAAIEEVAIEVMAEAVGEAVGEAVAEAESLEGFDVLEEQIDECMTLAKRLDRETLADVIHLLRRARNKVVWILGQ